MKDDKKFLMTPLSPSPAVMPAASPRKILEQQLATRPAGTSALTTTLGALDFKGVLQNFALESAFDMVSHRLTEYGQQVVVRNRISRPRWQPATLEKAIAAAKAYFFGGEVPRLFGNGVQQRVTTEFALECANCGLIGTPGQQAD